MSELNTFFKRAATQTERLNERTSDLSCGLENPLKSGNISLNFGHRLISFTL